MCEMLNGHRASKQTMPNVSFDSLKKCWLIVIKTRYGDKEGKYKYKQHCFRGYQSEDEAAKDISLILYTIDQNQLINLPSITIRKGIDFIESDEYINLLISFHEEFAFKSHKVEYSSIREDNIQRLKRAAAMQCQNEEMKRRKQVQKSDSNFRERGKVDIMVSCGKSASSRVVTKDIHVEDWSEQFFETKIRNCLKLVVSPDYSVDCI